MPAEDTPILTDPGVHFISGVRSREGLRKDAQPGEWARTSQR